MELNESLMSTSGVNLLVVETVLDKQLNEEYKKSIENVKLLIEGLNVNPESKSSIINFRNEDVISEALDTDNFVSSQIKSLSDLCFKKSISFNEAYNDVYKINLILGTDYKIKDIFTEAKVISENDDLTVSYKNIDLGIVNKFRNKLIYESSICNDCLYNDLYDESLITESMPKLYFLQKNYNN